MLQALFDYLYPPKNLIKTNSLPRVIAFMIDSDRVMHVMYKPDSKHTMCNRIIDNPRKPQLNDQATCITCLNTLPNEVLSMYKQLSMEIE